MPVRLTRDQQRARTRTAAAFEVWFFFFSGSPIDQRTGRGEIPAQLVQVDRRQVEPVALRP
jgi:hypothetical protein